VGEAIQAALQSHPAVESTSIAGPGFVNVVVSDSWLGERIDSMLTNGIGTWAPALAVSKCVHL
jgi:arginyl-tRNA synthetase